MIYYKRTVKVAVYFVHFIGFMYGLAW